MTAKERRQAVLTELIRLAAQMACVRNMPSAHRGDWAFGAKTPKKVRRAVLAAAAAATDQSRQWAVALRGQINALKALDALAAVEAKRNAPAPLAEQLEGASMARRAFQKAQEETDDA